MMCPLEFLVTPERNAEEEKLVGERKIPLNWEEKGDFFFNYSTSAVLILSRMSCWLAFMISSSASSVNFPS